MNTFKWFIKQHHQLLPCCNVFKGFKADPCGTVVSRNILFFFWCCTLKTTEPATFVFFILVCIKELQWSIFAGFIFHLKILRYRSIITMTLYSHISVINYPPVQILWSQLPKRAYKQTAITSKYDLRTDIKSGLK